MKRTFKQYKKFVENITLKAKGGIWKIELSNIAKFEDEFKIEYKYDVFKDCDDGSRIHFPVNPPFKVVHYDGKLWNTFEGRFQLSKKEILSMLKEAKEFEENY